MKRKTIAILLSGIMAFTASVPVSAAFEAEQTAQSEQLPETDVFSEFTDESADETVSFDDDSDPGFGSAPSDEEVFGSEEQELPVINSEIGISAANAGAQANTSVYREGASFGRQKRIDTLNGCGTTGYSYHWNWSSPIETSYYTDSSGALHIVTVDEGKQKLYDAAYRNSEVSGKMTVDLPLPLWGGFYAAPDGNFYVAVGQNNLEESTTKIVVKILKYDSSWNYLGCTDIPGGISNMFQGIYIPFDAASLRMTMTGNTLIVHTGREMFGMDGVHHQSSITFVINKDTMTLLSSSIPYTSHSFNQFTVTDGNSVYFLDHGDAYDRGLIISKYTSYGSGLSGNWTWNVFPFMGNTGDNYTGCEVTGFALEGNTLITLGKSVPHAFGLDGVTGYGSSMNQNVFLLLANPDSETVRFFWLSRNNPNGKEIPISEPKLVKTAPNQYVVLYSEGSGTDSVLHYLLMDGSGNISLSKDYKGVAIETDSQPIVHGNSIYWVSGNYDADRSDSKTWLYRIPVVTVPLESVSLNETSLSLKEKEKKPLTLNFYPENTDDVKDVQWTTGNSAIASVDKNGAVTGQGYGTTTITASCGSYTAQCKVSVTVPNSDKALPAPKLKLSQTRADKMHLSWNKISGAKGYQVFYKTTKNGSYKKLATIKNAALSYDAAVNAGTTYYFKVRAYGTNTKGKTKYSPSSAAKTLKAIVPAPSQISCGFGNKGTSVTWSKVTGASGYVVYRSGSSAKTLKATQNTWLDTKAYNASSGSYRVYNYYVKAFRTINNKKVYSKPSKTTNLYQ